MDTFFYLKDLMPLMSTIFTGDFLGYAATGVQEDSPIVDLLLTLHSLMIF